MTIFARRHAHDPMISDRDTKDVGRQVLQREPSVSDGLRIDDPGFGPDFVGDLVKQAAYF